MVMNENKKTEIFEGEVFTSFKGYQIKVEEKTWNLDINNRAYLKKVSGFSEVTRQDIIKIFIHFAKFYSSGYTLQMIKVVLKYPEITGEKDFTVKGVLSFKQFYNHRKGEPLIATFRTFLKKNYDLGYQTVSQEIYELINDWRLKGSEKGIPVLSLDPDEGPFSPFEFQAIITRVNDYLADEKISVYEAALIKIFSATGRRPIQIASLKVKDLYPNAYQSNNIENFYILNVPRAKIRLGSSFRAEFTEVGIRGSIAQVLFEHIEYLKKKLTLMINRDLTENEIGELPLFYDLNRLSQLDWNNKIEVLQILGKEIVHLPTNELTTKLVSAVNKLGIHSRDTGKQINITSYRFRYTLGTNAARQEAGVNVIAKLLDHSDTQSAHIYVQNIPEHALQISSIMDENLCKYADAFQGLIVRDEIDAHSKLESAHRISCHEKDCDVGSCGTYSYCRDHAPIACYLCNKFMPWANAPHHLILELLIHERENLIKMGCSLEIAAVNDRVIIAVQQVIDACEAFVMVK